MPNLRSIYWTFTVIENRTIIFFRYKTNVFVIECINVIRVLILTHKLNVRNYGIGFIYVTYDGYECNKNH